MKSDVRKKSMSVALVVTVILTLVVPVVAGAQPDVTAIKEAITGTHPLASM